MSETPKSPFDGQSTTQWEQLFSQNAQRMTRSIIREILKMMATPDLISFSGGMPAPELFPVREFQEACQRVLEQNPAMALQYGVTEGYPPLREYLVEKMHGQGINAQVENILIVNGSQQALDFIGRIFIDPGDTILTGNPTYLGALQTWRTYGARFVTVPVDEAGMRTDLLDGVLAQQRVKFIYVLPNFHNPAGVTLSPERRLQLVEVAAKHGVFIVEDDPYGELRFEGESLPPVAALHKENVIYLSTFSKTLSPGIRMGWIVAPQEAMEKLVQAKQASDLHTSIFLQMVVHDICSRDFLPQHVRHICQVYKERRDIMLQTMQEYFPSGATWTKPEGGLFLWVRLPEHVDGIELLKAALREKVAFVPGEMFFPHREVKNALRLNFSSSRPEVIQEGIRRLSRALMHEFG